MTSARLHPSADHSEVFPKGITSAKYKTKTKRLNLERFSMGNIESGSMSEEQAALARVLYFLRKLYTLFNQLR